MLKNLPLIPDLSPIKQQLENTPSNILFPPLEICEFYTLKADSVIFYQNTPQYYNYFKKIPNITPPYPTCPNTKQILHYSTIITLPQQQIENIFTNTNNILFTYTLNLPIEQETLLIQYFINLQNYNTTIISESYLKNILNITPSSTITCYKHNYTLYFYQILNNTPNNTCN